MCCGCDFSNFRTNWIFGCMRLSEALKWSTCINRLSLLCHTPVRITQLQCVFISSWWRKEETPKWFTLLHFVALYIWAVVLLTTLSPRFQSSTSYQSMHEWLPTAKYCYLMFCLRSNQCRTEAFLMMFDVFNFSHPNKLFLLTMHVLHRIETRTPVLTNVKFPSTQSGRGFGSSASSLGMGKAGIWCGFRFSAAFCGLRSLPVPHVMLFCKTCTQARVR